MKIPKYVIELMERAKYNYTSNNVNFAAGYTIDISKYSHYETIQTFKAEIERLVRWANRQAGTDAELGVYNAYILSIPAKTRHNVMQYATVTIYDPVMQHIEKYISKD